MTHIDLIPTHTYLQTITDPAVWTPDQNNAISGLDTFIPPPPRKQNILFVAGQLNLVGGAETFLATFIQELNANNTPFHPLLLVMAGDSKLGEQLSKAGIEIALLHQKTPLESLNHGDLFDIHHTLDTPQKAEEVLRSAGAWDFVERTDMVIGFMTPACVSASNIASAIRQRTGKSVPTFWAQRDTSPTLYNSTELIDLSRTLSQGVLTVICCSSSSKTVYQNIYPAEVPCMDILNGVDTDAFTNIPEAGKAFRERLGIPLGAPVIGVAARYTPMKNIGGAIHVARNLLLDFPMLHLVLCGSGMDDTNPELMSMVPKDLQDHFHLLGTLERSQMPDFYNACDIVFSPSFPGEAASNSLLEAISCGTQIVVTDVGDSAIIAGHDYVLPPPPAHEEEMPAWIEKAKARISLLLKRNFSPSLKKSSQQAVRERTVTDFSIASCHKHYRHVFHRGTVTAALQALGISSDMPVLLPGNRTNLVFKVESTEGTLFAKVYEPRRRNIHEDMARMRAVLPRTELRHYFRGQCFVGDSIVDVMTEIPGMSLEKSLLSQKQLFHLGRIVALFHQNTQEIHLEGSVLLPRQGQPTDPDVQTRWENLPKGIIHCDISLGNIRYDEKDPDHSVLLDLEAVREGVLLTDIARALYEFGEPLQNHHFFLEGYNTIRKLAETEMKEIPQALLYIERDRKQRYFI